MMMLVEDSSQCGVKGDNKDKMFKAVTLKALYFALGGFEPKALPEDVALRNLILIAANSQDHRRLLCIVFFQTLCDHGSP